MYTRICLFIFLFKFTTRTRPNDRELIRSEGSRTAGANPFYGGTKNIVFRVRRTRILGTALDSHVNSDVYAIVITLRNAFNCECGVISNVHNIY